MLGSEGSLRHLLLRTDTRRPQPTLDGLQRHVVGDRRELDFDVEDRIRREGVGRPLVLAERSDGSGSRLEQVDVFPPRGAA